MMIKHDSRFRCLFANSVITDIAETCDTTSGTRVTQLAYACSLVSDIAETCDTTSGDTDLVTQPANAKSVITDFAEND